MNAHKICFIMCVNDQLYLNECISYIEHLSLPEGFEREIIPVEGAGSMTSGYNHAMHQSDAKYKVYLHQDVFLVNQNFIYDILKLFENPRIGLIGMVGGLDVDKIPVMWKGRRVGFLYSNSIVTADSSKLGDIYGEEYMEVQAVDGLLMATQYDIPWREDILKRWDFYDVSQSMEYRRQSYQVVVPHMQQPWCVHDDGFVNLKDYYRELEVFLREYAGDGCRMDDNKRQEEHMKTGEWDSRQFMELMEQEKQKETEKQELREKYAGCRKKIDAFLEEGAYGQLQDYVQTQEVQILSKLESDVALLCIVLSVYFMEQQEGAEHVILEGVRSLQQMRERWLTAKFLMWRLEFTGEKEGLGEFLEKYQVSVPFLKYLVHTSSFDKANTSLKLAMFLKENHKLAAAFAMLSYVNELCPDEEFVLCEMADICMRAGQFKQAQEYIGRIQNPTGILNGFLERWQI